MYEGINVQNGGITVDLDSLQKNEAGELILNGVSSLKVFVENGASYNQTKLEILENNDDVRVSFTDANGNEIFMILKGLAAMLLANQTDNPVFEVFDGAEQLAVMTTIDDLEAAAAGGAPTGSDETANPVGAGDLGGTGSDDLALRIPSLLGPDGIDSNDPAAGNTQPITEDVTLDDVNEVLGREGAGDINTITGQLEVIDPDAQDAGLHTFAYVEGTLAVVNESGVIDIIDDGIEVVVNPDGSFTLVGDFNDLAIGESAIVSFQYTSTDVRGSTSEPGTVTVTVNGTNDIPVVEDITVDSGETITETISVDYDEQTLSDGSGRFTATTGLSDGGYIVAWSEYNDGVTEIYYQRFDVDDNKVGDVVTVSSDDTSSNYRPDIVELSNGDYIITWHGNGEESKSSEIFAQRYDSDGNPLGSTMQINTPDDIADYTPVITALDDGGYMVSWQGYTNDTSYNTNIYAQRFDSSDNPVGGEIVVNLEDLTNESNYNPSITTLSNGDFVVTWTTENEVVAQRFDSTGSKVGTEFAVSIQDSNSDHYSTISALSDGGYVITWSGYDPSTGDREIFAQKFDSSDNKVGNIIQVTQGSDYDYEPAVATLVDGSFVITWFAYNSESSVQEVYAQRFDSDGNAIGEIETIRTGENGYFGLPDIAALDDGGYVISYDGYEYINDGGQEANYDRGVYSHRFGFDEEVTYSGNLETYDSTDVIDVDDTQDDGNNIYTGVLAVSDDDDNDTHIFSVVADSLVIDGPNDSEENPILEAEDFVINIIENADGTWSYYLEGDFSALREGETATVSFQYVANDQRGQDGTDGVNESSISDPATITLTITGTNDQPIVENVTYGGIVEGTEAIVVDDETIYESHDDTDVPDVDDTQEDVETAYTNFLPEITNIDEDVNDIHTYFIEDDSVSIDNDLIEEFEVELLDSATGEFEVSGDFNALAAGETATISFQYYVEDDSAQVLPGETNTSEVKTAYVTITGTNDQPIVENVVMGEGSNFGDGSGLIQNVDDNHSRSTALNIDGSFTLGLNPDVENSETVSYISIEGVGNSATDWYEFTVSNAGDTAVFDIDYGKNQGGSFDPWLDLYDANGSLIVSNDDSSTSNGAGGSIHSYDSYLVYTFSQPGTYYIEVGKFSGGGPIPNGGTYTLQISLENAIMESDIIYESHDDTDVPDVDDTTDDVLTTLTGTLSGIDEDINDTLVFETQSLGVTSEVIDANLITLNEIILTNNAHNDDTPRSADFSLTGNFNALAAGETATVTFQYRAVDDSAFQIPGESEASEWKTVSITVTGTNDQPIIEDVVMGVEDIIYESHDDTDVTGVDDTQEDVLTTLSGTLEGIDEDVNDTLVFETQNLDVTSESVEDSLITLDGITLTNNTHDDSPRSANFEITGNFNALAAGETATVTFQYRAVDDSAFQIPGESEASEWKTVTITVTGTNDQPIVEDINVNEIISSQTELQWSENMIVNSDAEDGTGGWIGSNLYWQPYNGDSTTPEGYEFLGDRLFSGSSYHVSVYQDITLPNDAEQFLLSAYMGRVQVDTSELKVVFLDAQGNEIDSFSTGIITSGNTDGYISRTEMTYEEVSDSIPVGAVTARVYMLMEEGGSGSWAGGMIDNVVFKTSSGISNTNGGIIYESHDDTDVIGVDDTQEDVLTTITSESLGITLSDYASDQDDSDELKFYLDEGTVTIAGDIVDDSVVTVDENGDFTIEYDFNYLAVGETAIITFDYYADDQNGFDGTNNQDESSISESRTVTLTVTGTNDQPIVQAKTYDISNNDLQNNISYYEMRDLDSPTDGIDNTDDEADNILKGTLTVTDDDLSDVHFFNVVDVENVVSPDTNVQNQTIAYFNNDDDTIQDGNVQVKVESTTIDVNNIDIKGIKLLDNNLNSREISFELEGDFTALAEGETATVTFAYNADDQEVSALGDSDNEASVSETKLVTITVTGTNDQPIVENIVLGAQVFTSEDTPIDIPEVGTVTSAIEVSNVASIEDINVQLDLWDVWPSDLIISLISPDNTEVVLSLNEFRNYDGDEFNDDISQSAPYQGIFKPEGDLSDFDGLDANGTWTLKVVDQSDSGVINFPFGSIDFLNDIGQVVNWSLEFNSETYFESFSSPDVAGADDTELDDTGAQNENLTVLSNILTATDDDVNDTHTMHIANMTTIATTADAMNQTIGYEDGIASDDDINDNTRVVKVESTDVDVSDLRIDRIELSNNDDGTDSQSNFDLYGDFSALAAGESATITFAYQAEDDSEFQTQGESEFSEVKTVTITVTGTNDKPIVSEESYDVTDETYGAGYYETSDLDGRDDYDTQGYNWDNDGSNAYTQNDEDNNILKGAISVSDMDINDKHHFYVVDTAGNYAENIFSIDGDLDLKDWVVVESADIDPSNIDLSKIELLNESNNPSNADYYSSLDEIEFELEGNFSKLGAGQTATVTFSYIAVDDSEQHLPGEDNTSEVKTVTLTITGTNDEPIVWSVDNGFGVIETTIANAAQQAYDNVIAAGGTVSEANAAKLEAMSTQTQADRYGEDIEVPVEVRTSYVDIISGFDIDIEDTHTLHMKNTTSTNNTITVSTDDGDMQAAFSATPGIDASDIENLSIDFRTLVDEATSTNQTYSYLISGDFSSLGIGESATIVFDYVARDDSNVGINGEPDESDVKQITFKIWGTNDQPVVTSYDSSSEIQETNQAIDLPLAQLQQIAYAAAYDEVMDEMFDDSPYAYPTYEEGQQAYAEAQAAAIMAGNIAKEAVVANDELTVYGDGLGTIYNNDVIDGFDDDINDRHALFLKDLDVDSNNPQEQELLIDFSTTNGAFNDTGTDVKAVFTSDSANVTADDIKDVSVIFNTTEDALGSNTQQYTYQVVGNYNALGVGETATITFAYIAGDNSGANNSYHESAESEVHEITLTITGTNDKPVVQADSDSGLESTTSPVTTLTTQLEVVDADDTDMVEGHIFHIQDTLPLNEVDYNNVYSIRYVNMDTNEIGFVQVEIDGPLEDINTNDITLIINGNNLTLQGEFDPLAGEYTDNSDNVIPAEELSFKFKYYADDQNGFDGTDGSNENSLSDSKWMNLTITGTNDSATILDKNLPSDMDEDRHVDNGMLTTFGSVEVDDLDHGQDYFSTDVTAPTNDIGGTFNFNEDGTWTYEVDNSLPVIQALKENEYIDQTYTVTSIDGTDTHDITVRIWGTEDITIITDNSDLTGGVKEDVDVVTDILSATGTLYVIDPDDFPNEAAFNTSVTFNAGLSSETQLGTLSLVNQASIDRVYPQGEATWTYEVDNTDSRVQTLSEGQTITQVFTVTSADGSTSENIFITITGTNDAPIAVNDNAGGTFDVTLDTSNWNSSEATLTAYNFDGTVGTPTINTDGIGVSGGYADPTQVGEDGTNAEAIEVSYNHDVSTSVVVLSWFDSSMDGDAKWTVYKDGVMVDSATFIPTSSGDQTINIVASGPYDTIRIEPVVEDGYNDFYVKSVTSTGTTGLATEENTILDIDVLANDYDIDVNDTISLVSVEQPALGSTSIFANIIKFDPGTDFDYLAEGETSTVDFEYTITDGIDTDTATVTLTVTGTNDTPSVTVDTGAVVEDTTPSDSGQVVVVDADSGQSGVLADTQTGIYGDFSIGTDGNWTYTLASSGTRGDAVQALAQDQEVTESFDVTSADGTVTKSVVITVTGTNDQPVVSDVEINGSETIVVTNDTDTNIPDEQTTLSTLTLSGYTGTISDLNVNINLTHTWDSDLDITLIAPDGTRVELTSDNGIGEEDFTNTTFDDEATQSIVSGSAPFTGTFRPEGNLSDFDGKDLNGIWTLEIVDDYEDDVGVLDNWSLEFSSQFGPEILEVDGIDTVYSGQLALTEDLDTNDTHTFQLVAGTVQVVTSSAAMITDLSVDVDSDGEYDVIGNFDQLAEGETATVTFQYTATDDSGAANAVSDPKTVTLTVTGTNDTPSVTVDTGAVVEDTTPSDSGQVVVVDADSGQSGVLADTQTGIYGDFSIGTDGNWTYTLASSGTRGDAVQALAQDQEVTESFDVTSADGTVTKSVVITVTGTNDQPVVEALPNETGIESTTNDLTIIDGNLSAVADVDSGDMHMYSQYGSTVTVDSGDVSPALLTGIAVQVYGSGEYQVRGNFEALSAGDEATVTFQYVATDNSGAANAQSAPQTVTLTITGTNDAPEVENVLVNVAENDLIVQDPTDIDPANENATFTSTDPIVSTNDVNDSYTFMINGPVSTSDTNGIISAPTLVNIAPDGNYTVTNPDFNKLAVGEIATVMFNALVSDGSAFDTSMVMMTITGSNDKPTVTSESITAVDETNGLQLIHNGLLGVDDIDTSDNHTFGISTPFTVVVYDTDGTTDITSQVALSDVDVVITDSTTGAYKVEGNFDALADGQTAVISFGYKATDNSGAANAQSDEGTITLTVNGTNDAPVANDDTAIAGLEDTAMVILASDLLANDSDIDSTDTLSITSVTVSSGTASVNGDGNIEFTPANNAHGDVTLTYTVDDGNGGTDTATTTINVAAQADAPILDVEVTMTQYNPEIPGTETLDLSSTDDVVMYTYGNQDNYGSGWWVLGGYTTSDDNPEPPVNGNDLNINNLATTGSVISVSSNGYGVGDTYEVDGWGLGAPTDGTYTESEAQGYYTIEPEEEIVIDLKNPVDSATITLTHAYNDHPFVRAYDANGVFINTFTLSGPPPSHEGDVELEVNPSGNTMVQYLILSATNSSGSGALGFSLKGIEVGDPANAQPESWDYKVDVHAVLSDTDGSETLSNVVVTLPDSTTQTVTLDGNGDGSVTYNSDTQITDTSVFSASVTATEGSNNDEATSEAIHNILSLVDDSSLDFDNVLDDTDLPKVEEINLTTGEHILSNINVSDVLAMTETDGGINSLRIEGDTGDEIQLDNSQWDVHSTNGDSYDGNANPTDIDGNGDGYVTYVATSDLTVQLLINEDIDVKLV